VEWSGKRAERPVRYVRPALCLLDCSPQLVLALPVAPVHFVYVGAVCLLAGQPLRAASFELIIAAPREDMTEALASAFATSNAGTSAVGGDGAVSRRSVYVMCPAASACL